MEEFRGRIVSKGECFFGGKTHLLVTAEGGSAEAVSTPRERNGTRARKQSRFSVPSGSVVIDDKAYHEFEDLLYDAPGIDLRPLRRENSTRKELAPVEYVQHTCRNQIEATGSELERQPSTPISAVTAEGAGVKVLLFVLAVNFGAPVQLVGGIILNERPRKCHKHSVVAALFRRELQGCSVYFTRSLKSHPGTNGVFPPTSDLWVHRPPPTPPAPRSLRLSVTIHCP